MSGLHRLSPSRYAQVPDALLADASVSATAVRVYAIIVRYQGRHEVAWPGLRTIATDYGIPRSTVSDAVAELEAGGWLICERRPGTSSLYRPVERVSGAPDTVSGGADGVSGAPDQTRVRNESQGTTPPAPPRGGSEWLPVKVDRKAVTSAERDLCDAILAEFNRQAGTRFSGAPDHRRAIVGRIREHRAIELRHHSRIIAVALADPWWSGPPGPQVIYGKAGVFEQAIERARAARGSSLSADEVARLRDERHARIVADAEAAERAAASPEGAAARAAIRERFRLDERASRAS